MFYQCYLCLDAYKVVVLEETGTAYPSRAPGFTPGVGVVRVVHPLSLFVVFLCFICLPPVSHVCSMLPMSLDCPFLITPSVFSNVYLQMMIIQNVVMYCFPILFHPFIITFILRMLVENIYIF
jgi:hypothetical protein